MASPPLAGVLRYLRHLVQAAEGADQTDNRLLQQFVAQRDESAFATLLQRHGALVLGVCQQVLRDAHAAEDVFQATFLILARKAATIRRQQSLAAWLHRVAFNLARSARSSAARRRDHERQAGTMSQVLDTEESTWSDWQPLLHDEVNRLPEKYRILVVLCYLKGQTHDEAARTLGWPLGTVKGRLARARDLLRARLTRRGLALSTGALAGALAPSPAAAEVPAALLDHTLRAAVSFAASSALPVGAVSAHALTLAKGALHSMTRTRLTLVIALLLAVGGLGVGAAVLAISLRPGAAPASSPPDKDEDRPRDSADEAFGPEVKGLRAKVTLAQKQFAISEPIEAKYVVKNVSRVEQVIWHTGFWLNHQVFVRDGAGKEVPLTENGKKCRQMFTPGGPRLGNVNFILKPGQEDTKVGTYDLTTLYDLSRPGRYTAQYFYEEKQGGWEGRLPSNEAPFEVVAQKEAAGDEVLASDVWGLIRADEFKAPERTKLLQLGPKCFPIFKDVLASPKSAHQDVSRVLGFLVQIPQAGLPEHKKAFHDLALPRLLDKHWSVRMSAAQSLRSVGSAEDTPPLLALLDDQDEVGHVAAETLGAIGGPRDKLALEIWVLLHAEDKSEVVRKQAQLAIHRIAVRLADKDKPEDKK